MNITITLTIDEANYVLSALGSRPCGRHRHLWRWFYQHFVWI